jgi:hypothetical protein
MVETRRRPARRRCDPNRRVRQVIRCGLRRGPQPQARLVGRKLSHFLLDKAAGVTEALGNIPTIAPRKPTGSPAPGTGRRCEPDLASGPEPRRCSAGGSHPSVIEQAPSVHSPEGMATACIGIKPGACIFSRRLTAERAVTAPLSPRSARRQSPFPLALQQPPTGLLDGPVKPSKEIRRTRPAKTCSSA